MPSSNFEDLLTSYAKLGVAAWRNAGNAVQTRARAYLNSRIAETEPEAMRAVYTIDDRSPEKLRFIPMPSPGGKEIEQCFFLPIRRKGETGEDHAAFDLFLMVSTECLAFRFELADPPESSHSYGHVQFSKAMLEKSITVPGMATWYPDSYPAFPVGAKTPTELFLSMAIAVHGYAGGVLDVLQDMFQTRPLRIRAYEEQLRKLLREG